MKRFLEAGKIVNTHGVKGEVRIQPWADSADFLLGFELFYIDEKPVRLLGGRVHKNSVIAVLEGVDDVNLAMKLKGKTVFIDRSDVSLRKADFHSGYYRAAVRDEKGGTLGTLKDVLELPAGNVYVVEGEREILIPAVPEFILSTDVEGHTITVRLIEGM